jgi:hypothetical protein
MPVRSLVLLTRKEGMSRDEFNRHWLDVHGEIVKGFPHVLRYSQLHLASSESVGVVKSHDYGIDGVIEAVFDGRENIPRIWETEAGMNAIAEGEHFIGALRKYDVEEHVLVNRIGIDRMVDGAIAAPADGEE